MLKTLFKPIDNDPFLFLDNALDAWWGLPYRTTTYSRASHSYRLSQGDKELVLLVQVPGFTKETVEVSLDSKYLTVTGTRPEFPGEKDCSMYKDIPEKLSIQLPVQSVNFKVDVDKVEAKVENGVLLIKMPKKENPEEKQRLIRIQ